MSDFKPSQVVLQAPTPLTDCFQRVENELAAAMMVETLARAGDDWRARECREMGKMLEQAFADGREPWATINRNPFVPSPDLYGLVDGGWAKWVGDEPGWTIEFTPAGLERLAPWVRT